MNSKYKKKLTALTFIQCCSLSVHKTFEALSGPVCISNLLEETIN